MPASSLYDARRDLLIPAHGLQLVIIRPAQLDATPRASDTVLVGPPDAMGDERNVPDEYVKLLFNTERFRPEYRVNDEDGWMEDPDTFDNWYFAYAYVVDLAMRQRIIRDVRVVAAT